MIRRGDQIRLSLQKLRLRKRRAAFAVVSVALGIVVVVTVNSLIDGVRNVDAILSVPGVDGTFIGPYDLSASLGLAGRLDHPEVVAAKRRVLDATLAHGLTPGIHVVHPATASDELKRCIEQGYRFIALSSDMLLLGHAYRSMCALVQQPQS